MHIHQTRRQGAKRKDGKHSFSKNANTKRTGGRGFGSGVPKGPNSLAFLIKILKNFSTQFGYEDAQYGQLPHPAPSASKYLDKNGKIMYNIGYE
jgi:hypothetical protein